MTFFGLTGSRRELYVNTLTSRRPNRRHVFLFFIILFSILVPPLAVFIRFGIGTDFFINILLTIAGYIPGHYVKVELTFQRIRDNSLRPNRTPTWLRKAGLVKEERGVYKDRKWADRYVNASRPVQYDEDGHAHYLDEDEEEPLESDTNMLVDPDRFFEGDRSRRIRKQKARVDDESEEFYPSSSPPQATFSAGPPRGSKSLGARTRRFFGMHGRASSATDTYPEPMNRHYRISSAMGDMDVPTSHKSLTDREDPDDEFRSSPAWPSSSDATSYDDLDRELMGLSTQENFPPVRGSRRQPRFGGPSRSHIPSSPAQPSDLEPQRDVLDFEHTF